jgi:polysaccharide chain length determinant protein (PEP-CTERM system associated)
LEKIIREFNLFQDKENKNLPLERLKERVLSYFQSRTAQGASNEEEFSIIERVQSLRKKINVNLRGRNKAFEISFDWKDPDIAADIANALASQFIEQNLRVREEMAMGTTSFLGAEVQRIRTELIEKETALERFKRQNMGKLPDQLGSNLNILSQKREELDNLEQRVALDQQELIMLRNQMSLNKKRIVEGNNLLNIEGDDSEQGKKALLKQQLETLRTKYTEKHPDVQSLKRRIKNINELSDGDDYKSENTLTQKKKAFSGFSSQEMLVPQIEKVAARIAQYEKEIRELKAEISEYQERVEQTSEVELKLKNLQRDYETVNDRYQALLSKKLNAQMAEELEKRQKGEQFRVVDLAVAPEIPFKPNVKKIMIMAAFLGLGLGGGLAYVRESLDPAFYSDDEVESYLGKKVLVNLPYVKRKK